MSDDGCHRAGKSRQSKGLDLHADRSFGNAATSVRPRGVEPGDVDLPINPVMTEADLARLWEIREAVGTRAGADAMEQASVV